MTIFMDFKFRLMMQMKEFKSSTLKPASPSLIFRFAQEFSMGIEGERSSWCLVVEECT